MYEWRTLTIAVIVLATRLAVELRGEEAAEPALPAVLELTAFDESVPNATLRWQEALGSMMPLTPFDQAVLESLPDDPPKEEVLVQFRTMVRKRALAVAAFTIRSGESARMPPGFALGRGFALPHEWRSLARLKALHVRLLWWGGERARATTAAVEVLRASAAASQVAADLQAWVTWQAVAEEGYESALWIARQFDAGEEELTALGAALAAADGAWPDGAAHALRGELTFGFRGAVEHLGESRDIAEMLNTLADFGTPAVPEGAAEKLGVAEKPLLDPAATLGLYGEMAASFITKATADPTWRHGRYGEDYERDSEGWLAELGVFGELAMNRESNEYPEERIEAIKAALTRAENPVGKLLVVLGAPNLDGLAFTGIRGEAHRRCVRLLVEWRRRVGAGEELPADAAAWRDAGFSDATIEDPFTGLPLYFDPEKLRVWSVGLDGTNNRGTGDPRSDPDGADFWWSLETE